MTAGQHRLETLKAFALLAIVAVLAGGCGGGAPVAPGRPTATPTWEYKLAVLHGDPSTEPEFRRILDQIQRGGGTCRPEPDRQRIADTIYASWDESAKRDTLLDWARALASICE